MIIQATVLGIMVNIVPQSHEMLQGNGMLNGGSYLEETRQIYISSRIPEKDRIPYILHEDCHDDWYYYLNGIQRYRYGRYWRSAKGKHTKYGQTNVREGYADNCALWRLGYDIENTKYFKNATENKQEAEKEKPGS